MRLDIAEVLQNGADVVIGRVGAVVERMWSVFRGGNRSS